jgi:hypothetical protein
MARIRRVVLFPLNLSRTLASRLVLRYVPPGKVRRLPSQSGSRPGRISSEDT